MAKDNKTQTETKANTPVDDTVGPPQDEFAGQGGSYTYDPVTKTRTRNPD